MLLWKKKMYLCVLITFSRPLRSSFGMLVGMIENNKEIQHNIRLWKTQHYSRYKSDRIFVCLFLFIKSQAFAKTIYIKHTGQCVHTKKWSHCCCMTHSYAQLFGEIQQSAIFHISSALLNRCEFANVSSAPRESTTTKYEVSIKCDIRCSRSQIVGNFADS